MRSFFIQLVTFVLPAVSWAGAVPPVNNAPALDEIGFMALAIGLVATGVILLRRRGARSTHS